MSLKHIRRRYEFDKGLATGQKLDILANDPTLAARLLAYAILHNSLGWRE